MADTGTPVRLHPLVTRVLAPNASPYTYTGTQTHLVGRGELTVVDPGPDDPAHLAALLSAIDGRPVSAVLVTHHHRDHSPLSRALAAATGAPVLGPVAFHHPGDDVAFDAGYRPDRVLADGDEVSGDGWTLRAVATPGHTSNHLAYALPEAAALFSGDHVMGWSTSVVSPPDGDMGRYMASLEKLLAPERTERIYFPGHGDAVENPQRLVRAMLAHRRQREAQLVRALADGPATAAALAERMYAGLDARLMGAARRSVLAHLLDLERRGLAQSLAQTGDDRWAAA